MRDYIPINKAILPNQFNILLGDEPFSLLVDYNATGDLFTISLFKEGELICTEPVILGVPLFKDVYQPGEYPAVTIEPYGKADAVTFENLGDTVFLTIDDEGDGTDA